MHRSEGNMSIPCSLVDLEENTNLENSEQVEQDDSTFLPTTPVSIDEVTPRLVINYNDVVYMIDNVLLPVWLMSVIPPVASSLQLPRVIFPFPSS